MLANILRAILFLAQRALDRLELRDRLNRWVS